MVDQVNGHMSQIQQLRLHITQQQLEQLYQINMFCRYYLNMPQLALKMPAPVTVKWEWETPGVSQTLRKWMEKQEKALEMKEIHHDFVVHGVTVPEQKAVVLSWLDSYFVDTNCFNTYIEMRNDFLRLKAQPYIDVNYHQYMELLKNPTSGFDLPAYFERLFRPPA